MYSKNLIQHISDQAPAATIKGSICLIGSLQTFLNRDFELIILAGRSQILTDFAI